MPESPSPSRRAGAFLATTALLIAVGLPAALAQAPSNVSDPAQWSTSRFTDPFAGGSAKVARESFPITGIFRKQTTNTAERIVSVRVGFHRSAGAPPDPTDPCLPDAPPAFVQNGTYDGSTASYSFSVSAEVSTWPCNGRYVVTAEAQSNQEPGPYTITGGLTVAAPPVPVGAVSASVDEAEMTVTVNWEPLAQADLAPDAIGYRVERAGPEQPDGFYGDFIQIGPVLTTDTVPSYRDTLEAGGRYKYRVRSLRDGPDGIVPASAGATPVADAAVAVETTTTTTTSTTTPPTTSGGGGGTPGPGSRAVAVPRTPTSGPPTTVDTGFDEELDYSGALADDIEEPGELAAEGQSVIRTPGEGAGLLAPVAGALVLVGWAGHVIYLNRLARQF